MELKQALKKKISVINAILNNKVVSALKDLSHLVYASRNGNYIADFENLEQTYKNVLKYSFGYAKDPEREKIFNGLKRKLIELSDKVYVGIAEINNDWFSVQRKSNATFLGLGEKEKSELIDEMSVEKEFSGLLNEIEPSNELETEAAKKYKNSLTQIFDILWLKDNYSAGEKLLASKLFANKHIPWHDRALIVSAVTLSLFRHFDVAKAEILFDIYANGEEELSHRALVGLILATLIYNNRLELYPELVNRLKSYEDPKKLAHQAEQIILQFIRAKDTDKVTEKIQKEIIPEVMKIKPNIEEKLKLDELLNQDSLDDENPDWQDFFSDSPDVYKKLEEFSMMQMDGSDVFMSAFSMLKRFGFFEGFSNWFLPFYKEHEELQKSLKGIDNSFDWKAFFEGMEQAPVMCNSDKYSFCFNIGFMPDMQKGMMLEMFNMELKQMKEVSMEESTLDSKSKDKTYYTQYLQDLYRFFNLHPNKDSFFNVFNLKVDVLDSLVFKTIFTDDNIRQVGEFYFKNSDFDKAREIFSNLLAKSNQFELMEKIGFCYQKMGQFDEAVKQYKQAEILDNNRTWLHKKIGYCYRSLGEFSKSIEYYKRVEQTEPESLQVLILLGQLHFDIEDYDTALKYYFKVEYLKPDLSKVQRPIAWCSFLNGKHEQAIRYFQKVSEIEGQRSDFLNLGHCYWVTQDVENAIVNYRRALKTSGGDLDWFTNTLISDYIYLKSYGVESIEVSLMADFISLESD